MRSRVFAVVLTAGLTPYYPATFSALRAQSRRPDETFVVNVSAAAESLEAQGATLVTSPAATFAEAISQVIALPELSEAGDQEWLWILHDDSSPAENCLEQLLETAENSQRIQVVGPKQCAWNDRKRLLEVGIKATATARRAIDIEPGEIDQGQYDARSDVLAVGTAGMLVRIGAIRKLHGFNEYLGPFGEGLEFCRRVRLSGGIVAVAPQAVVFHRQASFLGLRGAYGGEVPQGEKWSQPDDRRSFGRRRRAQLYNWMLAAPLWQILLPLPIYILLLALGRALWRIVTKEPRLAIAEIWAALLVLLAPWRVFSGRDRIRRAKIQPKSSLNPLLSTHREISRAKRTARKAALDAARPAPLDAVAKKHLRSEKSLDRAVSWGSFVILTLLSLLGWQKILQGADNLPELVTSARDMLTYAWAGWIPVGDGYWGSLDPQAFFVNLCLVPLASLGVPPRVVLSFCLVLSIPLGWAAAWWAGRIFTPHRAGRWWLATTWALAPSLWIAVGHGRLSTAILAVALPVFVGALGRGLGIRPARILGGSEGLVEAPQPSPSISHFGLASIALAASAISFNGMILLLIPMMVFFLWRAWRWRRYFFLVFTPAVVVLLPTIWQVVWGWSLGTWRIIFADNAIPEAFPTPRAIDILLGLPYDGTKLDHPLIWVALILPGALTLVLALLGNFRIKLRPGDAMAGWALVCFSLAGGLAAKRVAVGVVPGGEAAAWSGSWLLIELAALLILTGAAWLPPRPANLDAGELEALEYLNKGKLAAFLATAAAIVPMLTAGVWLGALFTNHPGTIWKQPATASAVPATVELNSRSLTAARTLALRAFDAPGGDLYISAETWRGPGQTFLDVGAELNVKRMIKVDLTYRYDPHQAVFVGDSVALDSPDSADLHLRNAIAASASGVDAAAQLAEHGISLVWVMPGDKDATLELNRSLSASGKLESVISSPEGTLWRLPDSLAPARARGIARAENKPFSLSFSHPTNLHVPAHTGQIILAERANSRWIAQSQTREEAASPADWASAFSDFNENHPETWKVYFWDLSHRIWAGVALASLLIAIIAAIPLRRRKR